MLSNVLRKMGHLIVKATDKVALGLEWWWVMGYSKVTTIERNILWIDKMKMKMGFWFLYVNKISMFVA